MADVQPIAPKKGCGMLVCRGMAVAWRDDDGRRRRGGDESFDDLQHRRGCEAYVSIDSV